MKRNYVKPELEVVMFASESPILANSQEIKPGESGKPRTNKYQGGWDQEQWNTENYF